MTPVLRAKTLVRLSTRPATLDAPTFVAAITTARLTHKTLVNPRNSVIRPHTTYAKVVAWTQNLKTWFSRFVSRNR
jgi:hypothetical protein